MKRINGMVLIMALVFLLIMTLLVSASLLISQLSYKSALAGQQQLQLSQQALQQHLMGGGDNVQPESMQGCPAQYAGWSADSLRCEVLFLTTDVYSESRHFYVGYNSIMLKQYLITEEQ